MRADGIPIGRAIRASRKEKGIGIKKLAELSGVPATTICRIENLKSEPSFTTVCKLAVTLNMEIDISRYSSYKIGSGE